MNMHLERIRSENNCIIIEETRNFNIEQILECGQCFHFEKICDNEYAIAAKSRLLHIKQEGASVTFYNTDEETYREIWRDYFDMDMDYGGIIKTIVENEKNYLDLHGHRESELRKAVEEKGGVRILNQDFFETLISFIISQNKQIPHIKQIVAALSKRYGTYLGEVNGNDYYSFPDAETLAAVTDEEMRACRVGFRAPYILDASRKVASGLISEERLRAADPAEAKRELLTIKGVGEKIADCVLLFGLEKRSAFPVDVWIKRIMNELYFDHEASNVEIMSLAKELYGEYGGYAQQYLFYYGREQKLGKSAGCIGIQTKK